MPAPKNRRHSLYVNVISPELIIVKMPDKFMPWRALCRALLQALKRHLGLRQADVYSLEGIGGLTRDCDEYYRAEDAITLPKFQAAFAGDPDFFKRFHLFAWNDETQSFDYFRAPLTSC